MEEIDRDRQGEIGGGGGGGGVKAHIVSKCTHCSDQWILHYLARPNSVCTKLGQHTHTHCTVPGSRCPRGCEEPVHVHCIPPAHHP